MCGVGSAVSEDDVMQPIRHHAGRIHQVADRLQHGFEVVLFWFPSHDDIKGFVHVLKNTKYDMKKSILFNI